VIWEREAVALTQAPQGWLRLELRGRRPRIGADVLSALECALDGLNQPLVILSAADDFAFGADLDAEMHAAFADDLAPLDRMLRRYQRVMAALRDAPKPVVAAVRGLAISGGCELVMHCARAIVHTDAALGLAEAAVGVVPSGGGLKELARRAEADVDTLALYFTRAGIGRIASAQSAKPQGFLRADDIITSATDLEAIAGAEALRLDAADYAPPAPTPIALAGAAGMARLTADADARRHVRSAHLHEIAMRIARILTGVDLGAAQASEADLFALERAHFLELIALPETHARLRAILMRT